MGEVTRTRGLGLLFIGLLGFFGFFAHGYLENTDTEVTMHAAHAWYLRGDPGLLSEGQDTWVAERVIANEEFAVFGMQGVNGKYWEYCAEKAPSPLSHDADLQRRVWEYSVTATGVG